MIVLLTKDEILEACSEWVQKHHALQPAEKFSRLEYAGDKAIEVDVFVRLQVPKKKEDEKTPYRD
jgi:hypothetical protein